MMKHFGLLCLLATMACSGRPPAAPPPLRPTVKPTASVTIADCVPTTPAEEEPARPFVERSIPEAKRLAEQGAGKQVRAEASGADGSMRAQLYAEAVGDYLTSLSADPYNIRATYQLATIYAQVNRPQCAVNMLARLLQLRDHPSKRHEVDRHIDKLLGRGEPLDPAFQALRSDARFRTLIQTMCDDESDPACVLGGK